MAVRLPLLSMMPLLQTTTTTTTASFRSVSAFQQPLINNRLTAPSSSMAPIKTSSSNFYRLRSSSLSFSSKKEAPRSSVDVDSDEEAEQRLGDSPVTTVSTTSSYYVNGDDGSIDGKTTQHSSPAGGRFDTLLQSTNLKGKLKHVQDLSTEREVSVFDIFCNRELKMSHIKAIGFDMDYTLAQYQQPAFDQLAFDGAKEKLVYMLGFPKQVLDFQYDHEVNRS
jgi:hypothetical protein